MTDLFWLFDGKRGLVFNGSQPFDGVRDAARFPFLGGLVFVGFRCLG